MLRKRERYPGAPSGALGTVLSLVVTVLTDTYIVGVCFLSSLEDVYFVVG